MVTKLPKLPALTHGTPEQSRQHIRHGNVKLPTIKGGLRSTMPSAVNHQGVGSLLHGDLEGPLPDNAELHLAMVLLGRAIQNGHTDSFRRAFKSRRPIVDGVLVDWKYRSITKSDRDLEAHIILQKARRGLRPRRQTLHHCPQLVDGADAAFPGRSIPRYEREGKKAFESLQEATRMLESGRPSPRPFRFQDLALALRYVRQQDRFRRWQDTVCGPIPTRHQRRRPDGNRSHHRGADDTWSSADLRVSPACSRTENKDSQIEAWIQVVNKGLDLDLWMGNEDTYTWSSRKR